MKKKDSKNYLDFIPEKNPEIEYETGEDGIITVLIEWKGFYHKLAQRFFHRRKLCFKLFGDCMYILFIIDGVPHKSSKLV